MPQKLSHEADPKHVPDVVYVSPMEMKPNRVFIGLIAGAIILIIGITGAYLINNFVLTDATPTASVDIKKASPSAKIATPSNQKDETATWETYKNNELRYSIQFPNGTILPRSPCDSFVIPSSSEEENAVKDLKNKGIEIGFKIKGLELGSCKISKDLLPSLDGVKAYQTNGEHAKKTFAGRSAIEVKFEGGNFIEIYVEHLNSGVLRVWYRYGSDPYKSTAENMLSTFQFLD